jgi:hypothetical protein
MASVDDFIKHAGKAWKLRNVKASRRPLFNDGDRLVFTKIDERSALVDAQVAKAGKAVSVLGQRILCHLNADALVAIAYGRSMEFTVSAPTPTGPWSLTYAGDYLEGLVDQPDEGGDGDPDPMFP